MPVYSESILKQAGGRKIYVGRNGGIYILIKGRKKYLKLL